MHPQPRMQNKKAYERSHHGHAEIIRHSPRNGFNGFLRDLPGDRALLSPSPAKITSRRLDASVEASEPHDFAVREKYASSSALSRPPHPVPNVRDDRERPSVGQDQIAIFLRLANRQAKTSEIPK